MLLSIRSAADAVQENPDQPPPPPPPSELHVRTGSLAVALRAKRPEDDSQLQIRTGSMAVALQPEREGDVQIQITTGSLAMALEVERTGIPLQIRTGSPVMALVHAPTPGVNIMLPVGIDLDLTAARTTSAMAIAVGSANLQIARAAETRAIQVRTGSLGVTMATAPQPPSAMVVRTGSVSVRAAPLVGMRDITTGVEVRLTAERRPGSITMRTGSLNINMTMEIGGNAFSFSRDLVFSGDTGLPAGTLDRPVLLGIRLEAASFRSAADGGALRQPNAGDIEFVQISDNTVLPHNVVSHASNTTTGVIILDLRLPTWNVQQDFRVRMNYGANFSTPTNETLPSITGTNTVGSVLTCNDGVWGGTAPITITRKWRRDGFAFAPPFEFTGPTYTVVEADLGTTIDCRVTATNSFGSAEVNSNGIDIIEPVTTPAGWPYPQSTLYAKLNFNRDLTRYGQSGDQWPCSTDSNNRVLTVGCDGRGFKGTALADRREWRVSRIGAEIPDPTDGSGLLSANLVDLNMGMLDTIGTPGATQPTPSKIQAVLAFGASNIAAWYSFSISQASGFDAWRRRTYVATSTDDGTNYNLHRLEDDYLFRLNFDTFNSFEDLIVWGVLQLDPGYVPGASGIDNDYIYVYLSDSPQQVTSQWNPLHLNQTIWMARVRWKGGTATINNIWERNQYQMFTGLNPTTGAPTWGTGGAFGTKTPVFVDGNGMALFFNVGWHSAIGKFVATYIHCDDDANNIDHQGIAVAIADTPWNRNGWTMIGYDQDLDNHDVLEEDQYMSVMAPSRWNSGTDISFVVSTYVHTDQGGEDGFPGDNLIVTSAALTATGTGGSPFVHVYPMAIDTAAPGDISRPSFSPFAVNNYTAAAGKVIDLRDRRGFNHDSTQGANIATFRVNGAAGSVFTGGTTLCTNATYLAMPWAEAHGHAQWDNPPGLRVDSASGDIHVEGFHLHGTMDGLIPDSSVNQASRIYFNGIYIVDCKDDGVQNDNCKKISIRNAYIQGHAAISERPSGTPAFIGEITEVNHCLFWQKRQRWCGDEKFHSNASGGDSGHAQSRKTGTWNSSTDQNNTNVNHQWDLHLGWGHKWFLKPDGIGGGFFRTRFDMRNTLIRLDTIPVEGTDVVFPPIADGIGPGSVNGSYYENVVVLWMQGGGTWPFPAVPTGVTTITDTDQAWSLWTAAEAAWFLANGYDSGTDSFSWTRT